MNTFVVFICMACATLLGCQSVPVSAVAATSQERVTFVVSSSDGPVLESVEVIGISKVGSVLLGKTDGVGNFTIEKRVLATKGNEAVLFCTEGFYCAGFRPDYEPDFWAYGEHHVVLNTRIVA